MRWPRKEHKDPDKSTRQDYLEFLKEMRGTVEAGTIEMQYSTLTRLPDGSSTYVSKRKNFYVDELIEMLEERDGHGQRE